MRLIDTKKLQIEKFWDSRIPEYVILSHTWSENEISFEQFQGGARNDKILGFCHRAEEDGFNYAWVDTCCIDKTSSAELSEAINSMYKWYKAATICYAYIEEIPSLDSYTASALKSCRWFTRGWTLQELVAPSVVEFYARDWTEIGTKISLKSTVSQITGIPIAVLAGTIQPKDYNVAERMSWASGRYTTRKEDEAYSLLGIFNVHMPMLYGEGSNAFQRLQEEILKIKEDFSIFAWPLPEDSAWTGSLFATSPAAFSPRSAHYRFSDLGNIPPAVFKLPKHKERGFNLGLDTLPSPPIMTSRGICATLPVIMPQMIEDEYDGEVRCLAAICTLKQEEEEGEVKFPLEVVCINLQFQDLYLDTYARVTPRLRNNLNQTVRRLTIEELDEWRSETIYIPRNDQIEHSLTKNQDFLLSTKLSSSTEYRIEISQVYRIARSDTSTSVDLLPLPLSSTSYFKSAIGVSGVLILACWPTSGVPDTITVLFGQENSTPWCEVDAAISGLELKGTASDQVPAELHTIIVEHSKVPFHPRTDRWKGRLRNSLDSRTPRIEIKIRKAASGNRSGVNAKVILALHISVCTD